jgi:hypothetical protein
MRDALRAEGEIILTTIPSDALDEPLLFLPARNLNHLGHIEIPARCDLPPHLRGGATIVDANLALFHYIFTINHDDAQLS